jgi:hypothetical protein
LQVHWPPNPLSRLHVCVAGLQVMTPVPETHESVQVAAVSHWSAHDSLVAVQSISTVAAVAPCTSQAAVVQSTEHVDAPAQSTTHDEAGAQST